MECSLHSGAVALVQRNHLNQQHGGQRGAASRPVAHEGAQHHEAVLHAGDDLRRAVPPQQQLAARLEVGEGEGLVVPLGDHLLQLLLDVTLLHRADADVLRRRTRGAHTTNGYHHR